MMLRASLRSLSFLAIASTLALTVTTTGCSSGDTSDDTSDELGAAGDKVRWADATKLKLKDLSEDQVAKWATDGFNSALYDNGMGARIDQPRVYGKDELAGLTNNLEQRLGGTELGTTLNKARLATIESGLATHFVESGFKFRAGIQHDWSFSAKGLSDGSATIGLDVGTELESHVVLASDEGNLRSMAEAPLTAAKNLRGFIAPRSLDDVKKMTAGESFALRGTGRLATNLGLGVPVVASGGLGLAYSMVVSAGVAAVLEGRLDVQLMKLNGDEVVVDVGIDNVKGVKVRAAIEDGFGIKGVCEDGDPCLRDSILGGKAMPLAKAMEKAVARRLTSTFQTRAAISYEKEQSRVSLTRVRFHLDRGNRAEVEAALQQALKFDLRLAEAMSNRDLGVATAPVAVEFDAVRQATISTFDFGFKLAGIDIYDRTVVKNAGTFVLQTPDGVTTVSYDSLERSRKLFQTEHGVKRIGLGARTIDTRNPTAWASSANLFVRTTYSDKHFHDDRFTDGLDAVIGALGGAQALSGIDAAGGELERALDTQCPRGMNPDTNQLLPIDSDCNMRVLRDAGFIGIRDGAIGAFKSSTSSLAPDLKDLLDKAAETRLRLQTVALDGSSGSTDGVSMSVSIDTRFDDKALDIIANKTPAEYKAALRNYLAILTVKRAQLGASTSREAEQRRVEGEYAKELESMAAKFAEHAAAYKKISADERDLVKLLDGQRFVASPIGLRFETDHDANTALITSTSDERSKAAAKLFDVLEKQADRSDIEAGLYDEHTASLPFLFMVPARNVKVGLNIATNGFDDDKLVSRERFREAGLAPSNATATGADVRLVSLGQLDIEAALTVAKR